MNRIPFVTEGVLDIASDINSSLAAADGIITSRISGFLTEPPVGALDDSRYGVSAGATGKWFGKDGQLALYVAEGDFWKFYSPLHVFYLDTLYVSNGFSWTPVEGRLENKGKVVQTKGQSIYDVMSQKSVTDEINTKADTTYTDTELFKKVDKVTGQSLFKDTERTKLSGIATGATKNRSDAEMDVIWNTKVDKVAGKALSDTNFTQVEKTKLSGVAVGATKNATDAQLRARTSHTGEQPISTITSLQSTLDSKVDKVEGKELSDTNFTQAEKTKLSGIATGATKNATDAQLRARASHTGVQAISTITGLQGGLDSKVDKRVGFELSQENFSPAFKGKLEEIEAGATKNRKDSENANASHTHPISQVVGLITELGTKVDKVVGKELSDTNFTQVEKSKLAGVAVNATKNATDVQLRARTSHTGEQPISTVTGLQAGLDSKVDKVAGKGLSTSDFTPAEKAKLASLESSRYKGLYTSEASMIAGVANPKAGDYADVDTGLGNDVVRYLYDSSDKAWVIQKSASDITSAQIKAMYEENPDTNAFTDAQKSKLAAVAASATKNATDAQLRARASHTGVQAISTITGLQTDLDSKVDKEVGKSLISDTEIARVSGMATGATKNRPDSSNANASHTHPISDVTGLQAELNKKLEKVEGKDFSDENYTLIEKNKLAGIATGATKNATDAQLRARASHTGVQAISTVTGLQAGLDSKVDKESGRDLSDENYTLVEKNKLSGIASGATKNATDAQLRARASHTGVQAISTVTGLQAGLDSKVDKVTGKELSANDFSNVLKTKLDGLPSGVDGLIPLSAGGTGATSAATARTALQLGNASTRNFGTAVNTVMMGNDSRANNGQTAFSWGNHATAGYASLGSLNYTLGKGLVLVDQKLNINFGTTAETVVEGNDSRINNGQAAFNRLNIGATAATARAALELGAGATRWPTFAEVTGKPTTYSPSTHTHPWSQVTGQPATATRWPTFAEVTGKPATYAPSGHTHPWTQVTGQPDTATRWPTFAEVTDKPATYVPSGHTHPTSQVTGLDTALADKADKTTQVIAGTGLIGGGTLAANRTLNVSYGTTAGTAAQGNDSRLSNSREWTASAVSQAEAEAGTATTARKWTAQRVAQAISALGLKIGTTASTAKAGNWMPTWANVTGKPTTFTPSTHTHSLSQITDAGSVASLNTNASTANFLRGDGTWVTPPNTNTTYSEISTAEIDAGTASTSRTITGRRMKYALDKKSDTGHTHPWAQVTGQPATATRWPTFAEVTGKPTNYATTWASVASKPAQATRWPTLAEVTGKPTNYPTNWATVSNKPIVQTVGTSTTNLMSQKAVTDAITSVETSLAQPTMTSNAALNPNDNSIVATGIVTNLGLEVGDVIEVDNDNLQSGYLKPLGQAAGEIYQFATNGNDVYAANYGNMVIMKQTNGEGLFEKIEGVPAVRWISICFIGNQMYAADHHGRIYSVDETTGAVGIVNPTNHAWHNLATDGTHIYGCRSNTGEIRKVNPITKTEEAVVPTSPYGDVRGIAYSPIDNSLYIGAGSGAQPIRKLVNMTGAWIDVSTEKRPWSSASYYNGKVYFSDHVGQVWRENDAGDDFELFSKIPVGSPSGQGGNIIINDMLYKSQLGGDIYTTQIIKKDLFTVESIVSADKIIVNYAHAFGAGAKSLWHQTLSAAKFKRIAKWYNAPSGLGQAWVNVLSSRGIADTYTNTTGRTIIASISALGHGAASSSIGIHVDGMEIVFSGAGQLTGSQNRPYGAVVVPSGSTYSVPDINGWLTNWSELR